MEKELTKEERENIVVCGIVSVYSLNKTGFANDVLFESICSKIGSYMVLHNIEPKNIDEKLKEKGLL